MSAATACRTCDGTVVPNGTSCGQMLAHRLDTCPCGRLARGQCDAPDGVRVSAPELVTLTIDGREVSVPKGTGLVEAALAAGIEIPVFCYEPRLGPPVGACRMCLVRGRARAAEAAGRAAR